MRSKLALVCASVMLLAAAGCTTSPFKKGTPSTAPTPTQRSGSGPVLTSPQEIPPPTAGQPPIETPPPPQLPRERPRTPPATLGAASKSLVSQAQIQRKRGDFPGATVSLERALRIEPNNPLLWIELGRLRMDQGNFPQAESMGRKALSMSVGDDATQSQAWALISDSFRARGKNIEAQQALERSKELAQQQER